MLKMGTSSLMYLLYRGCYGVHVPILTHGFEMLMILLEVQSTMYYVTDKSQRFVAAM